MRPVAALLLAVGAALAAFPPNVRVDHQNLPDHRCFNAAIAVGPGAPSHQPLYVVFEDDSTAGLVARRSDVVFQKSTDAGATWLSNDEVVRRGESSAIDPDVTTDSDGNIYVVYTERPSSDGNGHFYSVRSTDGGDTWSAPVKVDDNEAAVGAGRARATTDAAGNLFCAWNDDRTGRMRIWSSVSTDHGVSWSPNVCVHDDTMPSDCWHADVFVQPGTNHYLVTATAPYQARPGLISQHAFLYRSNDAGRSFEPSAQLDTFDEYTSQPHVVADREHIICDYTGSTQTSGNQNFTEARTLYTPPDTWGPCTPVTGLDTLYSSYYSGNLAISDDGRVHAALMISYLGGNNHVYYAVSTDHGASWSARTCVDDDTTSNKQYPDIAVDSVGYAYLVWQDERNHREEIWFSTNRRLAVEEDPKPQAPDITLTAEPSVFSRTTTIRMSGPSLLPPLSSLSVFDASGRLVRSFALPPSPLPTPYSLSWSGRNASGARCPAGLYVVRCGTATAKVTLLPAD